MRLVIRDILRGRIEEVCALYDRSTEHIVENTSTCGYCSGKYLKELNYSLSDLVLLNIWFYTNCVITICVQNEEIIIIGNSYPIVALSLGSVEQHPTSVLVGCLRKHISLHQQDSIEQTIKIISEVIASFYH